MKKHFSILIIVILLESPTAIAQLLKSYGLMAGVVAATQSYDYHDHPYLHGSLNTSYRWGFAVGGELEFFESPLLDISAELLYIQKGYSIPLELTSPQLPEGTGDFITVQPRCDYLSVSPTGRLTFASIGPSLYALFEPRFDFLLWKNETSLDLNSLDIGATLGVGIQFSIQSFPKFFIEGRFSPSFTGAFHGQYLTVKNKSFEILTGVRF
jgi:hypothetical protein